MSAVMSTLSMMSGGRRAHRKLAATSRKSGQLSDAGAGDDRRDLSRQQRSASLQTLETGAGVVNLESLEAKMASIEVSLGGCRRRGAGGAGGSELSRDLVREVDALKGALTDKEALVHSLKKQLSASLSAARLATQATASDRPGTGGGGGRGACGDSDAELSADERRALEERAAAVRVELDARRQAIVELRRQLDSAHVTDNIDARIEHAELQYRAGREELELLSLGEQAGALQALLQQADARAARRRHATLYSAVRACGGESAAVVCVEAREGSWGVAPRPALPGLYVDWTRDALGSPGGKQALVLGDRVMEANGVSLVSSRSTEELHRALRSGPTPARLVVLRGPPAAPAPPATAALTQTEATSLRTELGSLRAAADGAEKAKEGLRADNTRLTHRISYLEEQVAELLARHSRPESRPGRAATVSEFKRNVTNISIGAETAPPSKRGPRNEVQVFQKGPDITAIVAKLPGFDASESGLPVIRPRSNASGAATRASPAPPPVGGGPALHHRSHSSHSLEHRSGRVCHSLPQHGIRTTGDYRAETDAAIRLIERNQRHLERQRVESDRHARTDPPSDEPELVELRRRDAADRLNETIKKTNWAERKTLSIIEQLKRSQRSRKTKSRNGSAEELAADADRRPLDHRIDGKVLENAHKSSRRCSKLLSRSAKSSEFESECSDWPDDGHHAARRSDYGSEPALVRLARYDRNGEPEGKSRPTPPRKPLRLSLHKARSAHSLATGSDSDATGTGAGGARLCDEADERMLDQCGKRPVKRSHGGIGDRWLRERDRMREGGRATPRPARRLLDSLSACEPPPPAADGLYPLDAHAPAARCS